MKPEVKILIWPGHHDLLDFAIKAFTHGRGCHAAFLRADGKTIHEAFWPQVRDREFRPGEWNTVETYKIGCLTPHHHRQLEALFDKNLKEGIEYSFADLLRYALNIPSKDERHTFCSRYVMHCLQSVAPPAMMPLVRLPDRDWAAPRDLRITPRLTLIRPAKCGPFNPHFKSP